MHLLLNKTILHLKTKSDYMQNTGGKSAHDKSDQQKDNESIIAAHKEADKDMEQDPDLSPKPSPGDDLDEGELARLEGEE